MRADVRVPVGTRARTGSGSSSGGGDGRAALAVAFVPGHVRLSRPRGEGGRVGGTPTAGDGCGITDSAAGDRSRKAPTLFARGASSAGPGRRRRRRLTRRHVADVATPRHVLTTTAPPPLCDDRSRWQVFFLSRSLPTLFTSFLCFFSADHARVYVLDSGPDSPTSCRYSGKAPR